jgi:predicted phage tail protein
MTLVNLHGILGYEFANSMHFAIHRPKEVIDAISSKFSFFKKRMNELAEQGVHYGILVDGEKIQHIEQLNINSDPNQIDLVPIICGSGGAGIIVALGALFSYGGAVGVGTGLFAAGTVGASMLGSLGAMMISMGLQMMLAPKPEMQKTEATVSGAKQSFLISSKANLAEQGNPVPVGYGRLRAGSYVIQTSVKSYPQRYDVTDALAGKQNSKASTITNTKE